MTYVRTTLWFCFFLAVFFGIYYYLSVIDEKQYGKVTPIASERILPDPILTPGMINPDISQANINQTICNKNWSTKSIRPATYYTSKLKVKQIQQYGYTDTNTKDYVEDHLISLELGGSPTSPQNLWPESYNSTPNDKDKDKVENYLHTRVCEGAVTLAEAQREISTDWTVVYKQMSLQFGTINNSSRDEDDEQY